MRKLVKLSALWLCITLVWAPTPARAVTIGQPAPDFALRDMQGNLHRLSDHRGQVVFLNFYAWSCTPCQEQGAVTESLIQQVFAGPNFQALGIDQWNGGPAGTIVYQVGSGVTYPLLPIGWQVAHDFEIDRQYLVIDANGIIRYAGPPEQLPINDIIDAIETCLGEIQPMPPSDLTISGSAAGLSLSWSAVPRAAAYDIYTDSDHAFASEEFVTRVTETEATLPLPAGEGQFYRVRTVY